MGYFTIVLVAYTVLVTDYGKSVYFLKRGSTVAAKLFVISNWMGSLSGIYHLIRFFTKPVIGQWDFIFAIVALVLLLMFYVAKSRLGKTEAKRKDKLIDTLMEHYMRSESLFHRVKCKETSCTHPNCDCNV